MKVGDAIVGFKFKNRTEGVCQNSFNDETIGKIGVIKEIRLTKDYQRITVDFGTEYEILRMYPYKESKNYLLNNVNDLNMNYNFKIIEATCTLSNGEEYDLSTKIKLNQKIVDNDGISIDIEGFESYENIIELKINLHQVK